MSRTDMERWSSAIPAMWTGDFLVDGGTGRFANVSGVPGEPIRVTAVNDPLDLPASCPDDIWTFSWTLHGKIDLGKK